MTNEAGRTVFRQAVFTAFAGALRGRVKKVWELCAASLSVLGTHDIIASVMRNAQCMRLCPSNSLIFALTQHMP
jgi:hypothetical protein